LPLLTSGLTQASDKENYTRLALAQGGNCILGFAPFCNYYELHVGAEVLNSIKT